MKKQTNDKLTKFFYLFYLGAVGIAVVLAVGILKDITKESSAVAVWTLTTVDSTGNVGLYTSIGLDSSANAHISYNDATNSDLKYVQYVGGGGGTGCASSDWTCTIIDSTDGRYTSIDVDSSNAAHISYYHSASGGILKYAQYVGGGTGSGCASSDWTCTTIAAAGGIAASTSIALDFSDNPQISFYDSANGHLYYAKFVGGGSGSGCTSSDWSCTNVDSTGAVGFNNAIALDSSNNPQISYWDASPNFDLKHAKYVGGASGTGCASADWTCTIVDTSDGRRNSIALDSSNNAHISYQDGFNSDLKYATYVGGGSGTGCASPDWSCITIDSSGNVGADTSIAIDSSNNPHISYNDSTNSDLKYAEYVGGGGGSGCASSDWTCSTVESTDNVGTHTSLALDTSDNPYISYYDSTNQDLKYATASQVDQTSTSATISNEAPEASGVVFNTTGGTSTGASDGTPTDATLTENTTTTVYCAGTITDNNGCGDIQSAIAWLYRVGGSGTLAAADCDSDPEADNDNCYKAINCAVDTAVNSCSGASDFTASYKCSVAMQYFAESTDVGSYQENVDGNGANDDANWKCTLVPSDESLGTSAESATGKEVNTLTALNVTASFSYGSLALGADTGATNQTTLVTNTGNVGIDTELSGTAMTCDTGSIAVGNQEYANATFTWGVGGTDLSGLATELDLDAERTNAAASTDPTKDIYWGLGVPATGAEGSCSGTNTVTALEDTNCGYTTCD